MKIFGGRDFGIIALAKICSEENINIIISREILNPKAIQEKNFWGKSVKNIVEEKTKFGRIGILFDRKNSEARDFCKTLAKQKFNYKQQNIRAEKSAKFSILEAQALSEMANEGLANSVEFRGILRKYIRNAKDLHLDSILFLEGIFAEKRTRQIITKMAGSQIKAYFITDFVEKKASSQNPAKKTFKIETSEDLEFTKKRTEQILQRKLKEGDVISLD